MATPQLGWYLAQDLSVQTANCPRIWGFRRAPASSHTWLVGAILLVSVGCGSDPEPEATTPKSDTAGPSFSTDSGGTVDPTDAGTPKCTEHADCDDPTGRCDKNTGECVQCVIDGDCPGGEICQANGCLPKSCKAGEKVCKDDKSAAVCNPDGKGFTITDCGDKVCDEGACLEVTCKAGEKTCATDGRALLTCNDKGTTLVKKPCATTETCFAAQCKPHVCKPGKKQCADASTVKTCRPDGLAWEDSKCGDGSDGKKPQSCDPAYGTPGAQAFCADQVCKPSLTFCDGNEARTCAKDGLSSELADNCNLNSATGKPRICKDGACIELKCKPGTLACVSWASVGKCLEDGQGYKKVPCGENSVCQSGKCISQACPPSSTYCEGNVVKKCNAFGTESSFVADCAQSGQTCFKGGCSKVICTKGTSKCSADGKVLQTCGPNGYEYKQTACGTGQTCLAKDANNAHCVQQICEPAKKFCDGAQPMQCNGYGTSASKLPACTGGAICYLGECKKKICTPGELKCKDANVLEQCATNGVAWDVVGCGGAQVCNNKKCNKKVCDPGKAICDGQVARGCDQTGLKWSFVKDCAKDNKNCSNGNCVAKFCGDGTCDKENENCTICPKDCGVCPPTGCEALPTKGCSGCSCEACVCQWDPTCCSQLWSGLCGQICKNQCGSSCTN